MLQSFISVPVFGKSRFGRPVIMVGKYKFTSSAPRGKNEKKGRWCCNKRGCKAKLFTEDDVIIATKEDHNH